MTSAELDILNFIQSYGKSSTCFLTAYPGFKHFEYVQDQERVKIAYIETATAWVGASEPLGPEPLWLKAIKKFCDDARLKGKTALLLPVSKNIALQAREAGLNAIQIGQEPWFKLKDFQTPKIAKQLENRGAKVGSFQLAQISARERLELETITQSWLDSRKSAPLDFLNQVKPWIHIQHKRYFRVIHNGHQLAYLSAIPVPALKAWYLIDLIRTPSAPLGTTELLIQHAVQELSKEGAELMTLGMSPFAEVDEDEKKVHPKLYSFLQFVFLKMSFFYNFKSLYQFKEKMKPNDWQPLYLLSSDSHFGIKAGLGIASAVFPQGVFRTLVDTCFKLFKRLVTYPTLNRFLSDQIVMRSKPGDFFELIMRLKVTLSLAATNVLFFIASTTDYTLRPTASARFKYNMARFFENGFSTEDVKALFLHSFVHWNLFHLLFNMFMLIFLVGTLEIIAGSTLVLGAYLLGILFSNPLTSILLEPIIGFVSQNLAYHFINEDDVGCSLGVFAGLGALAYFLKRPKLFLGFLSISTVLVTLMNSSLLGLNHIIALTIGYGIGNYYVRKTEK